MEDYKTFKFTYEIYLKKKMLEENSITALLK